MYKKVLYILVMLSGICTTVYGQLDSLLIRKTNTDTSKTSLMNMDANHNRPFMGIGKSPVALGGYMEANWQYLSTEGVPDGHQFQFRRFTIFTAASITNRIRFLAELEFEDGAKEIAVEFAAIDVEFNPLLNFRGGMIVNPIGAFNQNHDGPKWEFTDRPIAMTQMLAATWSTAGFGFFGKKYMRDWMVGYEFYISSGFDRSIIVNGENRTFLPASKENVNRFEESESGTIFTTTKLAVKNRKFGEVGLSHMGGIYNQFKGDGIDFDDKRRVDAFAVDFNTEVAKTKTFITGEFAWVFVDVPVTYSQQFGSKQQGGFLDIVQPIVRKSILGWNNATLNLALRMEYVDWNKGRFKETGERIGDDVWSFMPGISFRPSALSVFRFNYRFMKERDLFANPSERTDGFNFGVSTYF